MRIFSFCLILCFGFISKSLQAQLNSDSLSHISYSATHNTYLNDVWGYVDANGNEYALVGARKGVSIVDVTNPSSPNEVFWLDGEESIWRDINTWGNYAFVTTEAESGLLVLDLSSLPNASAIQSTYYTGPPGSEWQSAHTLYVDSAGYAYIFGANRGNGGVIILDIHTDPMNPIEIGVFDDWYCHDGYVLGDTMYLAHIRDGFMSIVDISDRSNPQLLGTKLTHNTFTHNVWTSPDGQYAFTTDEVSGAYVGSYDVSDPTTIVELDLVQNSPGKFVIPHNVHWINDYLVTSYYSDGVVVFDAKHPDNLIKVAQYDTYPTQTPNFDGCWASYPFLPSGTILAADITEGLFIGQINYQRASYLQGLVRNAANNNPLSNVQINIENEDVNELTKIDGTYKTGTIQTGNLNVTFFKVGFYPQTIALNFVSGQYISLNIDLVPIPPFPLKVIVKDKQSNTEILDAQVELKGSLTTDLQLSNGLGECDFQLYYAEEYLLTVGLWSYKTTCQNLPLDDQTNSITILLEKGYYDDFTFDYGWTTAFVDATSGYWERGNPNSTYAGSAPDDDVPDDCSDMAFVTGNQPNINPDVDDVDKGSVILYSPIFDLSNTASPYIHYSRWFYNFYGTEPYNDSLNIYLSNGDSTVLLDSQTSDESTFYKWNKKSFYIPDFVTPSQNMQLILTTADPDSIINLTEAGFDHFFIDSYDHYAPEIPFEGKLTIYPNPTQSELTLTNIGVNQTITLVDINGALLAVYENFADTTKTLDLAFLEAGMYFIKLEGKCFKVIKF